MSYIEGFQVVIEDRQKFMPGEAWEKAALVAGGSVGGLGNPDGDMLPPQAAAQWLGPGLGNQWARPQAIQSQSGCLAEPGPEGPELSWLTAQSRAMSSTSPKAGPDARLATTWTVHKVIGLTCM
jgi:hypothetical protein